MIPFEIAKAAAADVEEILHYYRAPSARSDFFQRDLYQAIAHMRQWPYTGHRRRDLTPSNVCFWYFEPYFLVLLVQENLLSIVAVLHGSRNVAHILRKRFPRTRKGVSS